MKGLGLLTIVVALVFATGATVRTPNGHPKLAPEREND
jgi:hypothetical protein